MFFKKNTTALKRTLMEAVHAESNVPLFCSLQIFSIMMLLALAIFTRSDFNYKLDGHRLSDMDGFIHRLHLPHGGELYWHDNPQPYSLR